MDHFYQLPFLGPHDAYMLECYSLLSALARVLARWTGQPDNLIQLEGHGREELHEGLDLTRTVGWFTSMFPVRLRPDSDDIGQSIVNVQAQLAAVPQKGIGYGVLRHLAGAEVSRQLAELPQARVTFNYLGQFDGSFQEQDSVFTPAKCAKSASLRSRRPSTLAARAPGKHARHAASGPVIRVSASSHRAAATSAQHRRHTRRSARASITAVKSTFQYRPKLR